MRKLLLLTSLVAIVLQTLSLPFLSYRLESNREVEAIPMCVNRDQPELDCFGSCYINEHLAAALAQRDAQQDAGTVLRLQAQPLIALPLSTLALRQPVTARAQVCFPARSWRSFDEGHSIWHPPRG